MRLLDWQLSQNELEQFVHHHLELGITTIDQADIYGDYESEATLGKVFQRQPHLRDKAELVSKTGIALVSKRFPDRTIKHYNHTHAYLEDQLHQSLRNLHTDYLDVLLIHRPSPLSNPEEVAGALNAFIQAGKIRYAGISNYTTLDIKALEHYLDQPLVTNQIEYNTLQLKPHQDGTIPFCQKRGLHPMAWSPLAGGRLFKPTTEREERVASAIQSIAEQYNASSDQIALAWILKHPVEFIPVVGTGTPSRIQAAAKSVEIELSDEAWFKIYTASTGKPVP